MEKIKKLSQEIVDILIEKKLKISTAESCTGGMLSEAITDISGSSQIFEYGVITYANAVKVRELGVSQATLDEFGAVSEQTCKQMANGVMKKGISDIGVGITGIAGPTGAVAGKPVGTIFVGVCNNKKTVIKKLSLNGDRENNRQSAVLEALSLVKDIIVNR
ncbi:MAG: CinA family protein [Oscillospiraceae bacterium]